MTHKHRKKLMNFFFQSAGCSLLRAESFSCSLDVLYVGLGISKLQSDPEWIRIRIRIRIHLKWWIRIRIQWIRIQSSGQDILSRSLILMSWKKKVILNFKNSLTAFGWPAVTLLSSFLTSLSTGVLHNAELWNGIGLVFSDLIVLFRSRVINESEPVSESHIV